MSQTINFIASLHPIYLKDKLEGKALRQTEDGYFIVEQIENK